MRYRSPRKTPIIPMYQWLEYRNRKREVEEYNIREQSAIHWYSAHTELTEKFFATPMQVYWDSFKEKFPDATVDHRKIKDDILELKEENEKLRSALKAIVDKYHNDEFDHFLTVEMRNIAQKALNGE